MLSLIGAVIFGALWFSGYKIGRIMEALDWRSHADLGHRKHSAGKMYWVRTQW